MPQNSDPHATEPAKAPARTHGDKLFDRWIYAGLNGVGTFILTIPLAYWGDHGKGQKAFKNAAEKLETWGMNPKNAETVVRTSTLGIGGTVMVLPVWVAEHFRKPIVGWFNQNFGSDKDKTAEVENTAPQTVASLLKGRVVAWLAVFSGFKLFGYGAKAAGHPEALQNFETKFGEGAMKLLGKPTHDFAALEKETASIVAAGENVAEKLAKATAKHETKAFRFAKIGALDVFATTAATSILYVTSRIFAKRRAEHRSDMGQPLAFAPNQGVAADALPAEASVPMNPSAPALTVSGEKIHPGVIAQDPVLHAQL